MAIEELEAMHQAAMRYFKPFRYTIEDAFGLYLDFRERLAANEDIALKRIPPPPCAMFPEKDDAEERERFARIWEATRAAGGG